MQRRRDRRQLKQATHEPRDRAEAEVITRTAGGHGDSCKGQPNAGDNLRGLRLPLPARTSSGSSPCSAAPPAPLSSAALSWIVYEMKRSAAEPRAAASR